MDSVRKRARRRETRQSPIESSSDELAAASDHEEAERRRASWGVHKNFTPQRPNPQSRHMRESDSPDELAVDAEEYWRSSRNRRSPSPINRPSNRSRTESLSEDRSSVADDEDNASMRDDESDRSATPVPAAPPLPPKPEHLNYREKFNLQGHLRGVSAVQFSPDCSMIASGGMYMLRSSRGGD